jgi:hypothetical protein
MPISGLPAVAQPLVGLPGTGKRYAVREVLSRQMSALDGHLMPPDHRIHAGL